MNFLNYIKTYLIWVFLSLLSGFCHMRIVLGPRVEPTNNFTKILDWHYYILFYVGTIIGSIIALLFILVDIFYLKKQIDDKQKLIFIRVLTMLIIAVFVGTTHYVLEEVIDII